MASPPRWALTIRHGINANDDSRIAEMPTFDWMERADREALADYVAVLPEGDGAANGPAAALFAENCATCHGEGGAGGLEVGAPSLTDASVIYGQDWDTILQTLTHGRIGVMPAWSGRLSEAEINLLALFVTGLSAGNAEAGQ